MPKSSLPGGLRTRIKKIQGMWFIDHTEVQNQKVPEIIPGVYMNTKSSSRIQEAIGLKSTK